MALLWDRGCAGFLHSLQTGAAPFYCCDNLTPQCHTIRDWRQGSSTWIRDLGDETGLEGFVSDKTVPRATGLPSQDAEALLGVAWALIPSSCLREQVGCLKPGDGSFSKELARADWICFLLSVCENKSHRGFPKHRNT